MGLKQQQKDYFPTAWSHDLNWVYEPTAYRKDAENLTGTKQVKPMETLVTEAYIARQIFF